MCSPITQFASPAPSVWCCRWAKGVCEIKYYASLCCLGPLTWTKQLPKMHQTQSERWALSLDLRCVESVTQTLSILLKCDQMTIKLTCFRSWGLKPVQSVMWNSTDLLVQGIFIVQELYISGSFTDYRGKVQISLYFPDFTRI